MNRAVRFMDAVTKTRNAFANEGVCAGFSLFAHAPAYTAEVEMAEVEMAAASAK